MGLRTSGFCAMMIWSVGDLMPLQFSDLAIAAALVLIAAGHPAYAVPLLGSYVFGRICSVLSELARRR